MATTTNYSWTTPDDTDLVKDGAAAIRTLGSSADTTVKNLNPGTTAGDIDYYTTSTAKARIGIGTAGQVLAVNSGATAPEWATFAGASGPAFFAVHVGNQAISQNVYTKVTFTSEEFDTDSCFASSTFTPNKAGYYNVSSSVISEVDPIDSDVFLAFYKNGSLYNVWSYEKATGNGTVDNGSTLFYMNGTTDTLEVYAKFGAGTNRNIAADNKGTMFCGVWIRS